MVTVDKTGHQRWKFVSLLRCAVVRQSYMKGTFPRAPLAIGTQLRFDKLTPHISGSVSGSIKNENIAAEPKSKQPRAVIIVKCG